MKIQGLKRITTVAVFALTLGVGIPTISHADNQPADTSYSGAIETLYSGTFTSAVAAYEKLTTSPAQQLVRTSAKYKAWLNLINASITKVTSSIARVNGLIPSPSYQSSDALLKKYLSDYAAFMSVMKQSFNKPAGTTKTATAQLLASQKKLASALTISGGLWATQYATDSSISNLAAPATAPSVTFTSGNDTNTNLFTLFATVSDDSTFSQKALQVTGYVWEWYEGSLTSTPIPGTILVKDISTSPLVVGLNGIVSGGTYFFRIAAVNPTGQGVWSSYLSTKIA